MVAPLDNEELRVEGQQKFENTWIELIEDNLKDEKFFINRHQNLLLSNLFSAKETLNTMGEYNYLNKKLRREYRTVSRSTQHNNTSQFSLLVSDIKHRENILFKNKFFIIRVYILWRKKENWRCDIDFWC